LDREIKKSNMDTKKTDLFFGTLIIISVLSCGFIAVRIADDQSKCRALGGMWLVTYNECVIEEKIPSPTELYFQKQLERLEQIQEEIQAI
jgi:hypothetical protein